MREKTFKFKNWLLPFSFLYGLGVRIRNKFFDWGIYKSTQFPIPIICVGNLAVGGTGKTPHTEYLINLLKEDYNVAVLSRGYKRKTKGYIEATERSTPLAIGDEPCQIKNKFPDVTVAVDRDRCHGIKQLMKKTNPTIDVIILDDAFQHRRVKPGLSILLTDYNRLFTEDKLLPAGQLREPTQGKDRAQIVMVTKCPKDIKPIDFNILSKHLELYPFQDLFFSSLKYGDLTPVFSSATTAKRPLSSIQKDDEILLVTGIANPTSLHEKLAHYNSNITTLEFRDHHNFKISDIENIKNQFNTLKGKNKIIITTEKDAIRLKNIAEIPDDIKNNLYALPVKISILQQQNYKFTKKIFNYVRENQRNR